MTNAEFVALIQRRLRDDTGKQWDIPFLTDAINAAFSALCHVVPQAFVEHRNLTLAGGTEQEIDADLHRIIHMIHNVCPTTGDAKRAIIKADLSIMDKVAPHWRQDRVRGHIIHYLLNPIDESKFYVWPPAAGRADVAPIVPPEPVLPVDPGELGNGGDIAADGVAAGIVVPNFGTLPTTFQVTPESPEILGDDTDGVMSAGGLVIDLVLPDDLGEAGESQTEISLNNMLYADYSGFGGNFIRIHRSATDSAGLTWAEVNGGDVLRIQYQESFTSNLVGINQFNEGTTQADIDAYQAALVQYETDVEVFNAAVAELAEYNANPPMVIRGVFTKTPCVLPDSSFTEVPPEPVLPINPGELGNGGDIADLGLITAQAGTSTSNGFEVFFATVPQQRMDELRATLGQAPGSSYQFQTGDEFDFVTVPPNLDFVNINGDVRINSFAIVEGAGAGISGWFLVDENGDRIPYLDPRMTEGNVLRIRVLVNGGPNSDTFQLVGSNLLDPGVTQADIDAYQAALVQYETDVEIRNSIIELNERLAEGNLLLSDPFPFDKAHELPVQEFTLYYALMRDDEHTANAGRAMQHWQNFYQLLNKREDSELLIKAAEEDSE